MKRILLFFCAILFAGLASAEQYGQITITTCYQIIGVPLNGGTFQIIGGTTIRLGSTNPLDFNSFQVFVDNNVNGTVVNAGDPIVVVSGHDYLIKPITSNGTINPGGWGNAILEARELKINIPVQPCIGFNQLVDFGDLPFDGLCGWDMEIFNPYTGTTTSHTFPGKFTILDGGFCIIPVGEPHPFGPRCMDLVVTLTIYPCELTNDCPPLLFNKLVSFCCDNCRPYGQPSNGKTGQSGSGLGTIVETQLIDLYPNPAESILTLDTKSEGVITVYNSAGQVIETIHSCGTALNVNVIEWPAGIYFVKLETTNGILTTGKLIISR